MILGTMIPGTTGMILGTMILGTTGMILGTMILGTTGMIPGTTGMILGTTGMILGTMTTGIILGTTARIFLGTMACMVLGGRNKIDQFGNLSFKANPKAHSLDNSKPDTGFMTAKIYDRNVFISVLYIDSPNELL